MKGMTGTMRLSNRRPAQSLREQAKNPGGAVSVFVLRQSAEGTVASERRQVEGQLEASLV